jgi:hypothetical protein
MKYDKQTEKNFQILYDLDWPTDEYRVFGGGIMSALKLKPWRDIDLVVSQDLYEWIKEKYKDDYWYSEETHLPIHFNSIPVELGWFPKHIELNFPGLYDLDSFWNDCIEIADINFIRLKHTLAYKKVRSNSEFVQVEEKDKQHIKLIEAYLKTSSYGF